MHKQLEVLTQKEMTRKEFLATLGLGIATVMGFGSIVKLLGGSHVLTGQGPKSRSYGSNSYGG
jgi:hypothetical protein